MIALHDLLAVPLDAAGRNVPVCRDGAAVLDRAAFRARVAALMSLVQSLAAQRYALCIDDPFDFACALFALFACGKEPVIPANATPGYLADLAEAYDAILTDATLPPHTQADAFAPAHNTRIAQVDGQIAHASMDEAIERKLQHFQISFQAGMPVDFGAELQQLARGMEPVWPRVQHRAAVAQACHALPIEQVCIDARHLRRGIGPQAEGAAGELVHQLEGLEVELAARA